MLMSQLKLAHVNMEGSTLNNKPVRLEILPMAPAAATTITNPRSGPATTSTRGGEKGEGLINA